MMKFGCLKLIEFFTSLVQYLWRIMIFYFKVCYELRVFLILIIMVPVYLSNNYSKIKPYFNFVCKFNKSMGNCQDNPNIINELGAD